jgi:hypothetical protein
VLNIQFSIENGRVGFDWCLIAPQNVRDESCFIEFANARGYRVNRKHANKVVYLRIEDGDLARLCQDVITRMYSLPETAIIDLIVEGFSWTA